MIFLGFLRSKNLKKRHLEKNIEIFTLWNNTVIGGFLKGNILKYQLRLGKKDEVSKEIEKIEDYKRELKNEN